VNQGLATLVEHRHRRLLRSRWFRGGRDELRERAEALSKHHSQKWVLVAVVLTADARPPAPDCASFRIPLEVDAQAVGEILVYATLAGPCDASWVDLSGSQPDDQMTAEARAAQSTPGLAINQRNRG